MVVRIITYLGVPDRRPDATPLIGFFSIARFACAVLNSMTSLGMPVSRKVA
jgi:hypothetical protein